MTRTLRQAFKNTFQPAEIAVKKAKNIKKIKKIQKNGCQTKKNVI